jgi:hypothetical protein
MGHISENLVTRMLVDGGDRCKYNYIFGLQETSDG